MFDGVRGAHVRDDQEAAEQLSPASNSGPYFWLARIVRTQAFLRHGQKLSLELAHIDGGMLYQRSHFFEQVGMPPRLGPVVPPPPTS